MSDWRKTVGAGLRYLLIGVATLAVIYNIFTLLYGDFVFGDTNYYYLLLACLLPLGLYYYPAARRFKGRFPWFDWGLSIAGIAICLFFFFNDAIIAREAWEISPPPRAVVLGAVLILVALEVIRRAAGGFLFWTTIVLGAYPFIGYLLPGFMQIQKLSVPRVIGFFSVSPNGIIGLPFHIVGEILIGYIMFGVVLDAIGGGDFFVSLAHRLIGQAAGGMAKISVISSGVMGMFSGSSISNVITTGSFTIPAMKKQGFPPDIAGAVEACSSTGGCIMPPVMGAAAFFMAGMLGVPYGDIALAAFIPAALYYLGLYVFVASYIRTDKGLAGFPEKKRAWSELAKDAVPYVVGFGVLVWGIFYQRIEARAPFYAIAALILVAMLRKKTRMNGAGFAKMMESIGKMLGQQASFVCAIGIVLGAFLLTGLASYISRILLNMTGGNTLVIVLVTMVMAYVLGMGVPSTASYVLMAVLFGPTLIDSGFDRLAVNMFLLFAVNICHITPPVAVASLTAATISGASPTRTGFRAVQIGMPMLILPLLIIYTPEIVLVGSLGSTVVNTLLIGLLLSISSASLAGYLWFMGRVRNWWIRGAVVAICLLPAVVPAVRIPIGLSIIAAYCAAALLRRSRMSSTKLTGGARSK